MSATARYSTEFSPPLTEENLCECEELEAFAVIKVYTYLWDLITSNDPHQYKLSSEAVTKTTFYTSQSCWFLLSFKYMGLDLEGSGDYSCVKLCLILEPTDICSEKSM
jgi:hypothetical protein